MSLARHVRVTSDRCVARIAQCACDERIRWICGANMKKTGLKIESVKKKNCFSKQIEAEETQLKATVMISNHGG